MKKVKSLYKLARKEAFWKNYYCQYCGIIEFDKNYINEHIELLHDEWARATTLFHCKKCNEDMTERKVTMHVIHCSNGHRYMN